MAVYAVKKGFNPGLYDTWTECEQQTKGFKGAEFKKFSDHNEAMKYILDLDDTSKSDSDLQLEKPYAFVDGSFNNNTKTFGYGGFLVIDNDDEKIEITGSSNDPELASMRNVAGEIHGSMAAIQKAMDLGLSKINIYYDYNGIKKWAVGEWKANLTGTRDYVKFIKSASEKININFIKVAAHTGIPGNELADKLAKRSVGIDA